METVGRSFDSFTSAEKDADGTWKLIITMTEGRKVEGGEWEYKKIEAMCFHNDMTTAYTTAMESAVAQLNQTFEENKTQSLFKDSDANESDNLMPGNVLND